MRSISLLLWIAFIWSLVACKQDDPDPDLGFKQEGFIKGKITGVSKDNSYTFNDDFNYTQYSLLTGSNATYELRGDTAFYFLLTRADNSVGYANIGFWLPKTNSVAPYNFYMNISYTKETPNELIQFAMTSISKNSFVITDFSFDQSTGKVKGKYSLVGKGIYSGKDATVIGEFELTAKKEVN